jgi:hypothetical protein
MHGVILTAVFTLTKLPRNPKGNASLVIRQRAAVSIRAAGVAAKVLKIVERKIARSEKSKAESEPENETNV